MKRLVFFFNGLYLLSLSLWVGGMFLLGVLVEIMVRVNLKDQPLVASSIMSKIMDVFNVHIVYTCIVLVLAAEVVQLLARKYGGLFRQAGAGRRFTREICLAIMIVLAVYMGSVLRPEMHAVDRLKQANPEDAKLEIQFGRYHSRFVTLYSINMILGLALFYMHGKALARFKED